MILLKFCNLEKDSKVFISSKLAAQRKEKKSLKKFYSISFFFVELCS